VRAGQVANISERDAWLESAQFVLLREDIGDSFSRQFRKRFKEEFGHMPTVDVECDNFDLMVGVVANSHEALVGVIPSIKSDSSEAYLKEIGIERVTCGITQEFIRRVYLRWNAEKIAKNKLKPKRKLLENFLREVVF